MTELKAALIGMGGIGQALAQQLLKDAQTKVFTLSRHPQPNLTGPDQQRWQHFVVADYTPQALREAAGQMGTLDLLVCTLGCLHTDKITPEKRLEALTEAALMHYFRINALLPMLVIQTFWPFLKQPKPTLLACLSAKVGSIEDNAIGGWYGYRASKAALNMLIKTSSIELKRRAPNLRLLAIHPGTTDTALSKPFQARVPEDQLKTPKSCAQSLLTMLLSTTAPTGSFLHWDGSLLPW